MKWKLKSFLDYIFSIYHFYRELAKQPLFQLHQCHRSRVSNNKFSLLPCFFCVFTLDLSCDLCELVWLPVARDKWKRRSWLHFCIIALHVVLRKLNQKGRKKTREKNYESERTQVAPFVPVKTHKIDFSNRDKQNWNLPCYTKSFLSDNLSLKEFLVDRVDL